MKWQKCPVCEGRGFVPIGFYSRGENTSNCNADICRTCTGEGKILEAPDLDSKEGI